GRSYFGYGLFTVKRLIEMNAGRMTVVSGSQCVTLDRYKTDLRQLPQAWQGTIVALVIDLGNALPLEEVYEEELARLELRADKTPSPKLGGASIVPRMDQTQELNGPQGSVGAGRVTLRVSEY